MLLRRPGLGRRLRRRLRDPLVVVPLVGALVTLGWVQYGQAGDSWSQADPGADLLPVIGADGSTAGWHVDSSRGATASLTTVEGRVTDTALQVDVTRYVSGDVTLTSPRVDVESGQDHLFKAHSTSDAPFTLLVRRFDRDGSDELVQLRSYPAQPGTWSTVADAFSSGTDTVAVQYVFRLASTGTLELDGAYLQPADDVQLDPADPAGPNLLPNPGLAGRASGPDPWSPYSSGASTVDFEHGHDPGGNYLSTRIRDYRDGEAKWQYPPIPVRQDQYLRFTASYRADREVDVVAEFELAGGGRRFANLTTVPPAGAWTTVTEHVQVPGGATSLMLTLVSHGDGTTDARGHELVDVSAAGPGRWDRARLSITFDDGSESAYDNAVPLLAGHGFSGTFYVNPATIEMPGFMTGSELQALHRDGHEIGVHGYSDVDLTALSADRIEDQLRKGQDELADAGLATDDLATPMGRSDAQVQFYARSHFQTVRGMQSGINTRQNIDPFDLRVFYVDDRTTPEALAGAVAETQRAHGWLVLVYHQVTAVRPDGTDITTITRAALAAQLDVIRNTGIAVEPVAKAYAEISAAP